MKLEDAIKTTRFVNEQHKATLNILYTAYWLKTHLAAVLKNVDISMEQHNVMRILNGMHPEPMCVKDIGSRMIEKSSNVPRIIDKLVEKRLARRAPSKADKRETMVWLTDRGVRTLMQAKELIDKATSSITNLDEEQARTLNTLMDAMRG